MPDINISKILRKHKGAEFKLKRIREDIGASDFSLEKAERPTILPEGIIIYTTKESDSAIHEIMAYAMGYTPQSFINTLSPAGIEGYDYRREIPLTRPTLKTPRWRGMNGRINAPGILIRRIKEQFPNSKQVKIEIAQGVELPG